MKFWNIFSAFASTNSGEVIHKVDDATFLASDGTVYHQQGHLITGSDGSVLTVLDSGVDANHAEDADSRPAGIAVSTFGGIRSGDDW